MKSFIDNSYSISDRLGAIIDGIKLKNEDKYVIAASFFSLSLEHHRSIIVLVENGLYGSASALLRSLFESYIRGLLFFNFATIIDIENLKKDKFNQKFVDLINGVEKECGKGVSKAKVDNWKTLNSLTHSGAAQISRRISKSGIKSNYDNCFIKDTLDFANNYALAKCL